MKRLLWPAVAVLIIIAIGAPCLTFFLLIKDYWAEVNFLRQKLLFCQLEFSDSRPLNPDSLLPTSLPFKSKQPLREEEGSFSFSSAFVTSEHRRSIDLTSISSQKKIKNLQKDFSADDFSVILNDDTTSSNGQSKKDLNQDICLPRSYVTKLEKKVENLTERATSCRKCLSVSLQKETKCGGGDGWRQMRKQEKLLKKEIKKHRKKRKRKQKIIKLNKSTTNATFVLTGMTPKLQSSSFLQPQSHKSSASDPHNARENHRAATDFRRGFNQKISRMDESLTQFTETQSSFCKELRNNLGGRLEKRGQELQALSEQIGALVRTTTLQVSMIEKLSSTQVYDGQTSVEKNLAKLQEVRDSETRLIQSFYKQNFLPAMMRITSLLSDQASSVTNMGVDLITKVEMLQDVYLTFATKQGDTMVKMAEEINKFSSKHNNLIMRSKDHAKHLHVNTENFIRELQTRMNNVVKELVMVRLQSQNFASVNEETYNEITSSLNATTRGVETLATDIERKINSAKQKETEFREEFKEETNLINSRIESGISEVLVNNHGTVNQIGETEIEARAFTAQSEVSWNQLYVNQETELRHQADMLANNLRSHNHHTQNILTGLQGTASTHEQVLEQQRMDFQNFIKKRQDALDTQCSSISDWASLMSSELRRRDEDLHRYLSEELQYSSVSVSEQSGNQLMVSKLPDGTILYDPTSSSETVPLLNITTEISTDESSLIESNKRVPKSKEISHAKFSPSELNATESVGSSDLAESVLSLDNIASNNESLPNEIHYNEQETYHSAYHQKDSDDKESIK